MRVGPPELLDVDVIEGHPASVWAGPPVGVDPVDVEAQVRAHGVPVPARARMDGDPARRRPRDAHPGTGPAGQAVVIYEGTRVIGSATVDATHRVRSAGSVL